MDRECCYDEGGYFISTGNEKIIVSQISSAKNEIMIHNGKTHDLYSEINSVDPDDVCPFLNKFSIKFIKLSTFIEITKLKNFEKKNNDQMILVCYLGIVDVKKCIPVPALMKALGAKSDLEISALMCNDVDFLHHVTNSAKETNWNRHIKKNDSENNNIDDVNDAEKRAAENLTKDQNSFSILNTSDDCQQILNAINASLFFCQEMSLNTRKKCTEYIGNILFSDEPIKLSNPERIERTEKYLENYFLPHIITRKSIKKQENPKFNSEAEKENYKKELDLVSIFFLFYKAYVC